MSRDTYIRCVAHGQSSEELGRASDENLHRIRDRIARRKEIADLWNKADAEFDLDFSQMWDQSLRNFLYFIRQHGECDIELFDEYGVNYDLSAKPEACFSHIQWDSVILVCQRDQADGHRSHEYIDNDDKGIEFKMVWYAWKDSENQIKTRPVKV